MENCVVANLNLVSIDPLRSSTLSFIIHLCLMEDRWRLERVGAIYVLVRFH